ncbi:efflux RND transporter periplasmic adaptor subunit [Cupriavidus basilensis]|uniref:efflux RND transporter periplasmic adaptor subunit n=1 Tax=Cupriavidus TaxID=106589 RepID=UPI0023E7AAD4|nr:HlyD family efflux transporter periplasmic adaptor subunit [Cupriavidus basilensis]MDF3881078.1 HlyD family efflux transporter periplasmic adaptor subunit [Cupriavidus basilensis]
MRLSASRAALILAGILLFAGSVYLLVPAPSEVDTVQATHGPLEVTTSEEGETRSKERFVIAAPIGGRLMRIGLREGDAVKVGQVVAELAPLPLSAREQEEVIGRVAAARAAHREALERVRHAAEDYAQAQRERQRIERLVREHFLSPQAGEQAANLGITAGNELAAVQARANAAMEEVRVAEAGMLALREYKGRSSSLVSVRAPVAGAVLGIPERSERIVSAGAPLLTIGDPRDLEIVVELLSTEAVKVRPGMPVRIEGWGGEQEIGGIVRLVEPHAFTKISVLGIEEKRANVIIDVIAPPAQLGDGFRVIAKIVLWRGEDASKIPVSSIFRCGTASWCVFAVTNGRATRREVRIGHRNAEDAELLEPLSQYDRIIRYPSSSLVDGQRVAERKRS